MRTISIFESDLLALGLEEESFTDGATLDPQQLAKLRYWLTELDTSRPIRIDRKDTYHGIKLTQDEP